MINAIRSALLNYPGGQTENINSPGEEFIPQEFIQRAPDSVLSDLWQTLTGPNASRQYRNYAVDQLLSVAHTCGFDSLIRSRDPRLTYNPVAGRNKWLAYSGQPQRTGDSRVIVLGTHKAVDSLGLSGSRWEVFFTETYVTISTYNLTPLGATIGLANVTTVQLTISGGLSQPIPLYGSPLSIQLNLGETLSDNSRLVALAADPYGAQAFNVFYAPPYGKDIFNASVIMTPEGQTLFAHTFGNNYWPFTYYPETPYAPQYLTQISPTLPTVGEAVVTAVARPLRNLAEVSAEVAGKNELAMIFNRTPEGKIAQKSYDPRGPVWAVIGPAVVAVGYAMLDSPTL